MAGGTLGTIRGQIRLDVANAITAYAAVRTANARTESAMNHASQRMKKFGTGAIGMGGLMLAGFGMAVNAAAKFEKKLDYFGAVSNSTDEEMKKVRDTVLDLGRTSAFSADQIADAVVEMGKAGVSAEDITDGMAKAIVNLASAADIDLAQATDIVTASMQAYHLKATDAAHITDVMAGAANASIIDVTDLGVSMKYVAGVASGLGISFDSTVDAISLLGKAGIKGSTAGTSLRQIMVSLAGGTNKAKGVLEDLGIITEHGTANAFFTAEGKAKSLAEIFQILQDHTADLSDKERMMAFRTIFNNRALAAASILTKAGSKGFADMNKEISKVTAADVASKRLDNLSGDIHKLKAAFETLLIEGGGPFQQFLRNIVQSITKLITKFANLPRGVQTGILTFMLVSGVALTLLGALAMLGAALTGAGAAVRTIGPAFRLFGTILRTVTLATMRLTVAALANPYVLIALAVIALVAGLVLLYQKSEKFRNIMNATGRGIKKGFLETVEWFKGLPKFFSDLWSEISDIFSKGVDWVKENWDLLLIVVTGPIGLTITIIRRFGDDIVNFVSGLPSRILGYITQAWTGFLNFLGNLPYYVGFAIGFVLGTLVKWGIQVVLWGIKAGKAIWSAIVYFFTQLPEDIWNLLVKVSTNLARWGVELATSAAGISVKVFNSVVNWFQKLPERIWNLLVSAKNNAISAWNDTITAAREFGPKAYHAIIDWFQKLPNRIWDLLVSAKNNVVNAGINVANAASELGTKAFNAIVDAISGLPNSVWNILVDVKNQFMEMVDAAFNAAKDFAKGLWDGFKSGLGIHSPSYIERAMFTITAVTDDESAKLMSQVKNIQGIGRNLAGVDMMPWTSRENQNRMTAWGSVVSQQMAQLRAQQDALLPTNARSIASTANADASQTASEAAESQRAIVINQYNPIAERGSDSAAKKLRLLSSMGAF